MERLSFGASVSSPSEALVARTLAMCRGDWGCKEEQVMDKDRMRVPRKNSRPRSMQPPATVGDAKLQSDGKVEKTAGKVQNAIGGVKDAVRHVVKK